MKVWVEYDAPVTAVVDTETERVERVVVWCEGLTQRAGEHAIVTAEEEQPVGTKERKLAKEIVDSTMWPAWDFG